MTQWKRPREDTNRMLSSVASCALLEITFPMNICEKQTPVILSGIIQRVMDHNCLFLFLVSGDVEALTLNGAGLGIVLAKVSSYHVWKNKHTSTRTSLNQEVSFIFFTLSGCCTTHGSLCESYLVTEHIL